jgi:pimeloyl-ACP methyl ester carboxylesterase
MHRFVICRDRNLLRAVLCGALLMSSTLVGESQIAQSTAPPVPGSLVDLGGYRVHLYCTGSGSPTVMIVGAAFSVDWVLVQSDVAKFARVCTFDPSGTAWSDSFETASRALDPNTVPRSSPTCEDRVGEIHRLISKVPIEGPYILVGFSVGALWERLYVTEYPENIVGMVIVDHAFVPDSEAAASSRAAGAKSPLQGTSTPVLISQAPIALGFEDDSNFGKLPERDQELHMWANAHQTVRPDYAMFKDCGTRIQHATRGREFPLGNMPLTVIRTPNESPGYSELQAGLLALSHHSQQMIAWNSSHMVPIDEPEVIVTAIRAMVEVERAPGANNPPRREDQH